VSKPDLLHAIPLFHALTDADRERLAREVVESHHHKGEYIFREGDPAESFHIVKSGSVKCVKSSGNGKEVTLKVLLPGDLFCCDAVAFEGGTHPGCAQSMGDVTVLRVTKRAYFDLLRRNPDAAMEVIRYLGQRLNEAQESAKVLALDRAEQRLASLLGDFARRAGIPDERGGVRLTIRLTRQDLANMAGLSVETVIRLMSRFKRARLVSGTARSLTIKNPIRLQSVASGHVPLPRRPKPVPAV